MRRIVNHELPDGSIRQVYPFHISLEGMESIVLCRDDRDYDAMVKIMCVAARRKNVVVIIYTVVSNHCHVAVLAARQEDAYAFGQEIKRMYAMWFRRRYGENAVLRGSDVKAILLDSDWYVRNALAYIPRNALDNGCNVSGYRWTGYRGMFRSGPPEAGRRVSSLTKRERERIMHTGDALNEVGWLIDGREELIPESICEHRYLEQAFEGDPVFFLKTIGGQNAAEMEEKLINGPRKMVTDGEFFSLANETSQRWFQADLSEKPRPSPKQAGNASPKLFQQGEDVIQAGEGLGDADGRGGQLGRHAGVRRVDGLHNGSLIHARQGLESVDDAGDITAVDHIVGAADESGSETVQERGAGIRQHAGAGEDLADVQDVHHAREVDGAGLAEHPVQGQDGRSGVAARRRGTRSDVLQHGTGGKQGDGRHRCNETLEDLHNEKEFNGYRFRC